MNEWKDYSRGRKICLHNSGFYIIRPVRPVSAGPPIFCPVCHLVMRSIYDDEVYGKLGCCDECAGRWAYRDMERWKSGWRPSIQEVEKSLQMKASSS